MVKFMFPNQKNSKANIVEHNKRLMMGFRIFYGDHMDEEGMYMGSGEGVVFSNGTAAYLSDVYNKESVPKFYNSLSDLENDYPDIYLYFPMDH